MTSSVLPGMCLFSLLMFSLPASIVAAPLPQQLSENLNWREQRLNNVTFDWQMTYRQRNSAEAPQEVQARQKAARKQLPPQLKRAGLDDKTIEQEVEAVVENAAKQGEVASYHSTTNWVFERHGDQALIGGVRQSIKDGTQEYFSNNFHQFYDKNWVLVINDGNEVNGRPVRPRLLSAWAAPGNGLEYDSGIADGLQVGPEHFTMLMGLNPLSMYGVVWKIVGENPHNWRLEAPIMQNGHLLFAVSCTLDRLHGNIPSQIQLSRGGQTFTFRAESYRQYNGEWLCDKVELHEQLPDRELRAGTDMTETWTLHHVGPSHPIQVSVPKGLPVRDYRLLGDQIYGVFEASLTNLQKQSIVTYRWPGQFPKLDELKKMQQEQRPGEVAPDPSASGSTSPSSGTPASTSSIIGSALPFAGGLLCVAGGVWMFKQRHTG